LVAKLAAPSALKNCLSCRKRKTDLAFPDVGGAIAFIRKGDAVHDAFQFLGFVLENPRAQESHDTRELDVTSDFVPNPMSGQTACTTGTFSQIYLRILSRFTFSTKGQVVETKSSFPVLVNGRIVLNNETGPGQQTVNGARESTDQLFFTSHTVDSNCQGELFLAPCTSYLGDRTRASAKTFFSKP